jgi:hypothetical protein
VHPKLVSRVLSACLTTRRKHNIDAKMYNKTINESMNLLPLHQVETNEPIAGFPKTLACIKRMEGKRGCLSRQHRDKLTLHRVPDRRVVARTQRRLLAYAGHHGQEAGTPCWLHEPQRSRDSGAGSSTRLCSASRGGIGTWDEPGTAVKGQSWRKRARDTSRPL